MTEKRLMFFLNNETIHVMKRKHSTVTIGVQNNHRLPVWTSRFSVSCLSKIPLKKACGVVMMMLLLLLKASPLYADNTFYGNGAGLNVDGAYNCGFGSSASFFLQGGGNTASGYGSGSYVIGYYNTASGYYSGNSVIGYYNTAVGTESGSYVTGYYNTASGYGSGSSVTGDANTASGYYSGNSVIGYYNTAIGTDSGYGVTGDANTASGYYSGDSVTGSYNIASGYRSGRVVTGDNNIASGYYAGSYLSGNNNIAIGSEAGWGNYDSLLSASNTISIGHQAIASGENAIAIGTGNRVSGTGSGAIGDPNTVTGSGSYVLGNDNSVSQDNTFVIGNNVTTTQENSVVLGNGSADKAAVATSGTSINGTTYDFAGSTPAGVVSSGSSDNERQLVHVAAGQLSETSTDAVNGSQLYATNQAVGDLGTQVGALDSRVSGLDSRVDRVGAMSAALSGIQSPGNADGRPVSIGVAGGAYNGEYAVAMGLNYNASKAVMFNVGGAIADDDQMGRAGITIALGKKTAGPASLVSPDEISELKDVVRRQNSQIGALVERIAELERLQASR